MRTKWGELKSYMANIDSIIKDLQAIQDGGTAVRGTRGGKMDKEAARLAKEALKNAKENRKLTADELAQKGKAYRLAQQQFKQGSDQYKQLDKLLEGLDKQVEANKRYVETLGKVGTSLGGFARAAESGAGTISSFTDNVKQFGVFGEAIAGLGNRLDVNIETFRQLSQSGANFSKSIVEMRNAAASAELPLDDFAKLVGENTQNLAALFGSGLQGAQAIAGFSRDLRRLGIDRLAPLGFTVDEINDTLLLNLERQRLTGTFDRLTRDQQLASSIRFAEELDKLAKLTGVQRDNLRKQMEEDMSNERFLAKLRTLDEAANARLLNFTGVIGQVAPALSTGIQDLIANGGVAVTEAAREVAMQAPEVGEVIRALINGTISSEQALVAIRDLSRKSNDRFNKVTQTGVVAMTRLQGKDGFAGLAETILDTGKVQEQQAKSGTELVKGLTTFEQASKVLASQFQQIETSLLQAFGPALGGFFNLTQSAFGAGGTIAKAMAGAPYATAMALGGLLVGKVLFNKAAQVGIIAAGTAIGTGKGMGGIMRGLGLRGGGRLGSMAAGAGKFGLTRALPGVGAAFGVGTSVMQLMDKDDSNNAAGVGGLIGGGLGGLLGLIGGPGGALLGASLGSMAGQYIGSMFDGKYAGGELPAGQTVLVGEKGPELVTSQSKSMVTSNADLGNLNFRPLETKMASMVSELNNANKTLTNMVNGVNTLVAVSGEQLKTNKDSLRTQKNMTGNVLIG